MTCVPHEKKGPPTAQQTIPDGHTQRERAACTAPVTGGATFPRAAALPAGAATTLVMLPSAARFLACAAAVPAALAPSAIAGRLAAADDEEERREAARVDIGGRGPSPWPNRTDPASPRTRAMGERSGGLGFRRLPTGRAGAEQKKKTAGVA